MLRILLVLVSLVSSIGLVRAAWADPPAYLQVLWRDTLPSAQHSDGILYSPSNKFFLKITSDCGMLILPGTPANPGQNIWTSGTDGKGTGCLLMLGANGDFGLYNSAGTEVWFKTSTWFPPPFSNGTSVKSTPSWVFLQDDGNLIWFGGGFGDRRNPLWASKGPVTASTTAPTASSTLTELPLAFFQTGQVLTSLTNQAFLEMQNDCNLVSRLGTPANPGAIVHSTGTNGKGNGCYLVLQADGNLVIFNNTGTKVGLGAWGGNNPQSYWIEVLDSGDVITYVGVYPDRSTQWHNIFQ